jgi:hypothetical protein
MGNQTALIVCIVTVVTIKIPGHGVWPGIFGFEAAVCDCKPDFKAGPVILIAIRGAWRNHKA